MKFTTLAVLCFLVCFLFVLVAFDSNETEAAWDQHGQRDWKKVEGLNWTKGHEDGVIQKFNELKVLLEYYHNIARSEKSAERMALLLNRQGTIIEAEGRFITGEEEIAEFFKAKRGQSLTIGSMEIDDVGFVNRVIDGHKVDHYVKLKYNIKLVEKDKGEVLKNDDFPGVMILMHRYNCPWDG